MFNGRSRLGTFLHNPLIREFVGYGSTTVLDQGSRVGVSLIAAAVVGPAAWGSWVTLELILRYGALAHLGSLNGLNRQYPFELGRGNEQESEALRRASLGALVTSTMMVLAVTAVVVATFGVSRSSLPIFLTLGLLVTQQLYIYVITTYKSRIDFGFVSRAQIALAIAGPAITLPLTVVRGLEGFIVGQAASNAVIVLTAFALDKRTFQFAFDLPRTAELVRVGFPIMLVGAMYTLFSTVDRWIILGLFSSEVLGHYSVAIIALGAVALFAQIMAQQYYPRMAKSWGASHDLEELKRMAVAQGLAGLVPTVILVLAAELVGPTLIRWLLPEYSAGVQAFRIIVLAPIITSLGLGYANLLNVTDRQYQYMSVIGLSLVLNIVCSYALGISFGLVGVAWGTVAAFTAFSLGVISVGRMKPLPAASPR